MRLLGVAGIVDLQQFALTRNLAPAELDRLSQANGFLRVGPERSAVAVTASRLAVLCDTIAGALETWHRSQPDALGPTRLALLEPLRAEAPEAALDAALAELGRSGRAVRQGAVWRLPEHRPRPTQADERLWERVRPLLAAEDLRPPRVRELAAALAREPEAVERFLTRAERFGRVARIADNRFFLPETLTRLADIARELADHAPDGTFTAATYKDRSGVGRNLTIQILEYFDRIGVTCRQGDARLVLRDGREVFG